MVSSEADTPRLTLELLIEQEARILDHELTGALAELDDIIGVLTEEQFNTLDPAYGAELSTAIVDYKAAREELLKAAAIFNVSDAGSRLN